MSIDITKAGTLNRANHTGTQPIDTVDGLEQALTEAARYPTGAVNSLTVNRGNEYPFADQVRDGVSNPIHSFMLDGILDITVLGAEQGKLYKLSTIINGSTAIPGTSPTGWHIEEHDAEAFSSTSLPGTIVVSRRDAGPEIDRGRVSTIVLESSNRVGLKFYITLDGSKLPPFGTAVNMGGSGFHGYNWYIDPVVYRFESTARAINAIDSLTVNRGKVFPFNSSIPRNGTINDDSTKLMNLILDVAVIGAEAGKYYRIAYLSNTGTEDVSLGWILEEYDAVAYTTNAVRLRLHNYTNAGGTVKRSGGIQTVTIATAVKPSVMFRITLDAAQLPASGSNILAVNPGFAGYSWIVDQSRYFYRAAAIVDGVAASAGVYYEYDSVARVLSYAYRSGSSFYKVTFGVNGYNNLPNLIGIYKAALADDVSQASWVLLSATGTDYLPPMIIEAINNGDTGSQIYTGGNHGADGSDGGGNTARNVLFNVLADGKLLAGNSAGYANTVQAHVINELFAYNTIHAGRYAVRQAFRFDMSATGMEVHADVTALEEVRVKTDNGPQAYLGGFNTTQLMLGGQNTARIPLDTTVSSGPKTEYPEAWCLLMKSDNGTMACWVDRSYEAGDGRYVHETSSYIRGPGENRAKFYHAICAAAGPVLAEGEGYKWRGGYHFFNDTANATFDTAVSLRVGDVDRMVAGYPDGKFLTV